jgi:hypothetical protein
MVQYLNKQMDTFQVCQLIVGYIHTHWEKQSCISPVDNFVCAELQEELRVNDKTKTEMLQSSNTASLKNKNTKYCNC